MKKELMLDLLPQEEYWEEILARPAIEMAKMSVNGYDSIAGIEVDPERYGCLPGFFLKGMILTDIHISHRLAEVSALADRVLVLRDGENAGELHRHQHFDCTRARVRWVLKTKVTLFASC